MAFVELAQWFLARLCTVSGYVGPTLIPPGTGSDRPSEYSARNIPGACQVWSGIKGGKGGEQPCGGTTWPKTQGRGPSLIPFTLWGFAASFGESYGEANSRSTLPDFVTPSQRTIPPTFPSPIFSPREDYISPQGLSRFKRLPSQSLCRE